MVQDTATITRDHIFNINTAVIFFVFKILVNYQMFPSKRTCVQDELKMQWKKTLPLPLSYLWLPLGNLLDNFRPDLQSKGTTKV